MDSSKAVSDALSRIRRAIEAELSRLGDADYEALCEEIWTDMDGRLEARKAESDDE